ncbi:hypothetical protein [Actinomadura sp. 6N118]|uniref:hypothetical protein n=1 Tax=Actinomadura sp. 6N118 TaxID=3375151 RepID=UPI0037AA2D06
MSAVLSTTPAVPAERPPTPLPASPSKPTSVTAPAHRPDHRTYPHPDQDGRLGYRVKEMIGRYGHRVMQTVAGQLSRPVDPLTTPVSAISRGC